MFGFSGSLSLQGSNIARFFFIRRWDGNYLQALIMGKKGSHGIFCHSSPNTVVHILPYESVGLIRLSFVSLLKAGLANLRAQIYKPT